MDIKEIIGFVSFTITTLATVPQVIRTIKTKETKGLSLSTLIMFVVGLSMWAIYGFMIGSTPVVIANFIGMLGSAGMLIMKLKNG